MPMQKYSRNTVLKCLLSNKDTADTPSDTHALASIYRYKGSIEKYWKSLLDSSKKLPKPVETILSLGTYELKLSKKNKPYASVSECVNLTKKYSAPHAGLVNAVLKKISTTNQELYLRAEDNFPAWIKEQWASETNLNPRLKNLMRIPEFICGIPGSQLEQTTSVSSYLKRCQIDGQPAYVQSYSSRFVVEVVGEILNQTEGVSFLDICAGKGGKFLGILLTNKSLHKFTAADISEENLSLLKSHIIQYSNLPGFSIEPFQKLSKKSKQYDVVLVDAPCTGSGTWAKNPMSKWICNPSFLKECSQTQEQLIQLGYQLLKPNGFLVYGVCSLFQAEGGNHFRTSKNWEPHDFSTKFLDYHDATYVKKENQIIIEPSCGFDGFYLSCWKKIG